MINDGILSEFSICIRLSDVSTTEGHATFVVSNLYFFFAILNCEISGWGMTTWLGAKSSDCVLGICGAHYHIPMQIIAQCHNDWQT